MSAGRRRGTRNSRTRPLVKALKDWLEQNLTRIPPNGPLAEAIRYALARWPALCRFLERLSEGHSVTRLDELLPWNWKPESSHTLS